MADAPSDIGDFIIGESPIGGDVATSLLTDALFPTPAFDFNATVISQYANSPTLLQLIENFDTYIDPTVNLQGFFDLIWNVDTAIGYGLDVWGRIVGVVRALQVQTVSNFGFSGPSGASGDPFNVSPFYNGQSFTSNYNLTDDAFRTLIYAKALANISDGSIPALNQILLNLFPNLGNCFVADNGDMTMSYVFTFHLTPVQFAIVSQSGVLPKPSGVSATVVQTA
jgi:hypothetical protein